MEGLAEVNSERWAQARLIAYWSVVPYQGKGRNLKITDIMKIPLIDKRATIQSDIIAKAYKLKPEEVELWHAGKWVPPDETKSHDNSTTTQDRSGISAAEK